MNNITVVDKVREMLPPVFPATKLNKLSGGIFCWATLQNLRTIDGKANTSRFPNGTFITSSSKKIIIDRDKLLEWWDTKLKQ